MRKIIILLIAFLTGFLLSSCASAPKKLRCNFYVTEEMTKKNIYLPDTTANSIDNYMRVSEEWKKIPKTKNGNLDHSAAYKAAKAGKIVIASYNTGTSSNGHVVIVSGKKKMEWSSKYNANVPYAKGSINGSKPKLTLLSYQFSADKQPRMNYYIYQKKK